MCNAGGHQQGEVCSQTASCALTTTTTASSPEETALQPPAVPAVAAVPVRPAEPAAPAEVLPCTQGAALSQLSTVIASDMCASVKPPRRVAQGSAQVQGKLLPQPFMCCEQTGAQPVRGHMGADNLALTKAGLLMQSLLDPPALLAMLGLNANTAQDSELATCTDGTPGQAEGGTEQTPAGLQGPKTASASTAAASLAREASEAAAEHALTNDEYVGKIHAVREVQRQGKAAQGSGGSLMTMLGLGGGAAGSGGDAYGRTLPRVCEEEEAGLRVHKLAAVALHVVEVLLDAVLTQPEVSGRNVLQW